jgi:hypothetical protein
MVTAIFETRNLRTWISGNRATIQGRLDKIKATYPKTFKLVEIRTGHGVGSSTSAKVVA